MFSLNDSLRYWLWSEPTDMRKSFYTLSGLVRTKMGKDPLDGSVYVFINARRDRIKLLHMEPGGLVLYMKVLERGKLHIPQRLSGPGTKAIEWRELVNLLCQKDGKIAELETCILKLRFQLYGSKCERNLPSDPNAVQLTLDLFSDEENAQAQKRLKKIEEEEASKEKSK